MQIIGMKKNDRSKTRLRIDLWAPIPVFHMHIHLKAISYISGNTGIGEVNILSLVSVLSSFLYLQLLE